MYTYLPETSSSSSNRNSKDLSSAFSGIASIKGGRGLIDPPSVTVAAETEIHAAGTPRASMKDLFNEDVLLADNDRRTIWHFPKAPYCACGSFEQKEFSSATTDAANKRSGSSSSGTLRGKVILIGDIAVGKTSLLNRFCRCSFDNDYKTTIGVDFEVETFTVLGCPFHLEIWDTGGQERFRSLAAAYYRGATAILVAFDLTDKESLASVPRWVHEAREANDLDVPVFVIGTKKDLAETYWNLAESAGLAMAKYVDGEYWCTSSLTGECIVEFFHRVAAVSFEVSLRNQNRSAGSRRGRITVIDKSDKPKPELYEENSSHCAC